MTLNELIKMSVALLEEYDQDASLSNDNDFIMRFKLLFNIAQYEISNYVPIRRSEKIELTPAEDYVEYSLPNKFKKITAVTSKQSSPIAYYIANNKIYIKSTALNCEIFFESYPAIISEETNGEYEPEISQDAQIAACYEVVWSILSSDPSQNYAAFERKYQSVLSKLISTQREPILTVGTLIGGAL